MTLPGSPSPAVGVSYESQAFGYRVTLPLLWRRATHPALAVIHQNGTGRDVFTVRSEDEDARLVAVGGHAGAYPVLSHTAVLNVLDNPRRLSVTDFIGQSSSTPSVNRQVSGRPAVRLDGPPSFGIGTVYVARDDVVLQLGPYDFWLDGWLPTGWADQKLRQDMRQLVDSLELTR